MEHGRQMLEKLMNDLNFSKGYDTHLFFMDLEGFLNKRSRSKLSGDAVLLTVGSNSYFKDSFINQLVKLMKFSINFDILDMNKSITYIDVIVVGNDLK